MFPLEWSVSRRRFENRSDLVSINGSVHQLPGMFEAAPSFDPSTLNADGLDAQVRFGAWITPCPHIEIGYMLTHRIVARMSVMDQRGRLHCHRGYQNHHFTIFRCMVVRHGDTHSGTKPGDAQAHDRLSPAHSDNPVKNGVGCAKNVPDQPGIE
jgi:hypothetical protein